METSKPSIRGSALRQSIDWLGQLLATRRTTPHALGARLRPADFALFAQPIDANGWYPVDSAERIDEALILAHGGRPGAVMRALGARRAGSLVPSRPGAVPRALDAHVAIDGPIDPGALLGEAPLLNFGRWRRRGSSHPDFELELCDATPLPESTRLALAGFLQARCVAATGRDLRVESRRPAPDRALFRARAA
jgi:hypothetical protein